MKPTIVSIQIGAVRTHGAPGSADPMDQPWTSAIFKFPVQGPLWLGESKLQGDGQADRRYHGGLDKAVLAYSADHYPVWREDLGMPDLPFGAFGENLTIQGQDETAVCIGDKYRIGDALVEVSQPRQPCFKLARRWRIKDLTARVKDRGWGGWYLRVLEEGYIDRGMELVLLERRHPEWSVIHAFEAMVRRKEEPETARALAQLAVLSVDFKEGLLT